MNDQIIHALNAGVPVWISNFAQKVDVSVASSNIKPSRINKRPDVILTDRNFTQSYLLINNKKCVPWGVVIQNCLFLSEEQAIAHYNNCVDNVISNLNEFHANKLISLQNRKI